MVNMKLILTGIFVLITFVIACYIGIQQKRIDNLKAHNAALRVSLESAESAIVKQNETITALMSQLAQSDTACQKQLEARNTIKAILKKDTKPPVSVPTQSGANVFPFVPRPAVGKSPEVISYEKNITAVRYINDLFRVRPADGL